jgi:hypothetical protein
MLETLLFAALLGLIPAIIARKKGRSFVSWWIYGTLLLIVALPHILLARDRANYRCPYCAEWVRREATICAHRHSPLSPGGVPAIPAKENHTFARGALTAVVVFAILFMALFAIGAANKSVVSSQTPAEPAPALATDVAIPHHDPGTVTLCPKGRMTRDGCK